MPTEPSIADLKSAFAAHLSTLPPPAPGRHDHYRPRTRAHTVLTAGAAFAGVVAVASATVAFAGRDPGPGSIAAPPSAQSTMDIAGTTVELPAGVHLADPDACFVRFVPEGDDSRAFPGIIVWWPAAGPRNDCFLVQTGDDGTVSPPPYAEPTTVAGLTAWTWRVDEALGIDDAHAYFVELPSSGDRPATPLVVVVTGPAVADVPRVVNGVLDQLENRPGTTR